jgi:phosphoribosylformylglycinamidine (FGAM) synthase-like enzyme
MIDMRINLRRSGVNLLLSSLMVSAILLAPGCSKQVEETARKTGTQADEAAAVRTLQNIFRVQTQFALTHAGEYGSFDDLVKENYLDQRFSGRSPELAGYVFTIRLRPGDGTDSPAFAVNADPKQTGNDAASGARHLFMDSSSNVVRFNANQPASINDPPLQ